MPDYFVTAVSYRDDAASCHRPASSEFRSREPTVADARRDENCVVRRAKLVALPKSVDVFTQHLDRTCSELRLVEMKTSFENTTDIVRWSIDLRYMPTGQSYAWHAEGDNFDQVYPGFIARGVDPDQVTSWEGWRNRPR